MHCAAARHRIQSRNRVPMSPARRCRNSALLVTRERVADTIAERSNVEKFLAALPGVRRVYASQGNFLLVRFDDAEDAFQRLLQAGVVVRDMRSQPQLGDALRITIGSPEQNLQVLEALAPAKVAAA